MIGGLVASYRLAQALTIEISFDGPHDLIHTVPLFLACALVSLGVIFCGVLFLKNPTKRHAFRVARACTFSLWILLANLGVGAGLSLLFVCLVYFFALKPATIGEFGIEKEPPATVFTK